MKRPVVWYVPPSSAQKIILYPAYWDYKFFRNADNHVPDYTASYSSLKIKQIFQKYRTTVRVHVRRKSTLHDDKVCEKGYVYLCIRWKTYRLIGYRWSLKGQAEKLNKFHIIFIVHFLTNHKLRTNETQYIYIFTCRGWRINSDKIYCISLVCNLWLDKLKLLVRAAPNFKQKIM
jgi:hypothetical protein